jgi:hypothetical protein
LQPGNTVLLCVGSTGPGSQHRDQGSNNKKTKKKPKLSHTDWYLSHIRSTEHKTNPAAAAVAAAHT